MRTAQLTHPSVDLSLSQVRQCVVLVCRMPEINCVPCIVIKEADWIRMDMSICVLSENTHIDANEM